MLMVMTLLAFGRRNGPECTAVLAVHVHCTAVMRVCAPGVFMS